MTYDYLIVGAGSGTDSRVVVNCGCVTWGLRAVDAAVMPRLPTGNTTHQQS